MLNKVAVDLPEANLVFTVGIKSQMLDKGVETSSFYVCQYYNNNTTFDLTVMDNIGYRQTLRRKKERTGDKIFRVVREYRINYLIEDDIRNFFDEITEEDGEVLMALKAEVSKPDYFRTQGFGTNSFQKTKTGYLFYVFFDIDQDQMARQYTIDCPELGITISRVKRHMMPPNSCYAVRNCLNYNPFNEVLGDAYLVKRIYANSTEISKERYWYFIGDILTEVEYTNNKNQPNGIYIEQYKKVLHTEEIIVEKVKFFDFSETISKNGFFTSQRDAMLSSNSELIVRERSLAISEREHAIKLERIDAERRLDKSRLEVIDKKQKADMQGINNTVLIENKKHENTLASLMLENNVIKGKTILLKLTDEKDQRSHENAVIIDGLQFRAEKNKALAAILKHELTITELNRAEDLNHAVARTKLSLLGLDLAVGRETEFRKICEEKSKRVTLLYSNIGNLIKMIGK